MKKEKRVNKKLILLSLAILSLLIITTVLVAADTAPSNPDDSSLWGRWKAGALKNTDAKILILIMTSVIIYALLTMMDVNGGIALLIAVPFAFILTAFVTPESVLGIIRSYNTLPLAIATMLPLIVLFLATYASITKGSRSLMTLQLLFWWVYFAFNMIIFLAYWHNTYEWGWFDNNLVASMISLPSTVGGAEEGYFWVAMVFRTVISGIMSIWNGFFMTWAMKRTLGIDKALWQKKMSEADMGLDTLMNIGKKMEGKSS